MKRKIDMISPDVENNGHVSASDVENDVASDVATDGPGPASDVATNICTCCGVAFHANNEDEDEDQDQDQDEDDGRYYCDQYLPLAEEVDDAIFGYYDCGLLALQEINPTLNAVAKTDNFLESITDDTSLEKQCYINCNLYPDLLTFHSESTTSYNHYLHQLLFVDRKGAPVRVRIKLSYSETPTFDKLFYHAYRVRITFNHILVYSGANLVPIDYLQSGAIFAILQLRNKNLGKIIGALSHTPMGGNGNCISAVMDFIA